MFEVLFVASGIAVVVAVTAFLFKHKHVEEDSAVVYAWTFACGSGGSGGSDFSQHGVGGSGGASVIRVNND